MSHINYKFTKEFQQKMKSRPDRYKIKYSDIKDTLTNPDEWVQQEKNNNFSCWKYIKSQKKVLRVIVQNDGRTVVTAYYDRDYLKKYKRKKKNQEESNSYEHKANYAY